MEKNGGQAFPRGLNNVRGVIEPDFQGMTMRQYYKAKALQGLVNGLHEDITRILCTEKGLERLKEVRNDIANVAAHWADAMIAEDEEFEKRNANSPA